MLVNGVDANVQGYYKLAIVDSATDRVVWEQPDFKKNLILNGGMDMIATNYWGSLFNYAIAGTGTRPNSYDSAGAGTTASQSGTAVTASGGTLDFTTSAAAGDTIKWASGALATVQSVTDATHIVAVGSQTVASGNFVIWKTSQTGLQTEVKRSNSYLTGSGNCGTTLTGNQAQFKRTIDFPTEVGSVTYTEIGFSPVVTANTSVFSRILLATPIAISSGQRLRVVYQLNVTFTPDTPSSKSAAIGGWPVAPSINTDGQEQIQALAVVTVNTNGVLDAVVGAALEPAGDANTGMWISPSSTALAAVGASPPDRTVNASFVEPVTRAAYVNGSYTLDKTAVFDVGSANRNDLRSMGLGPSSFGVHPSQPAGNGFTFLFSQSQTKANTQTLSLTFRYIWGRTLA
jgi:hypothetical protein